MKTNKPKKKKGKTSKDAVEFDHWNGKHINKRVKIYKASSLTWGRVT